MDGLMLWTLIHAGSFKKFTALTLVFGAVALATAVVTGVVDADTVLACKRTDC